MKKLIECIKEAEEGKKAIGHFNIANLETFWAIVGASEEMGEPAIIGLSEGERAAVGGAQAKALVESTRKERNLPIFINADHHHTIETFKEAVDLGYDMAIIDGAKLSLEENIALTKEAVEYARARNPEMLVEGEIGYIGTSSKLLDELPEGAEITEDALPTADEARRFVEETGVDLLAPAVGNLHGMLKGAPNPNLNIERIREIKEATGVPLVLHGGSGISDGDFRKAIEAGMSIVHVNTEIRVVYRKALEKALSEKPDEVAPYKYLDSTVEAVKEVVKDKIKLFSGK